METPRPILIVEDNPNDAALIIRALKNVGVPNRLIEVNSGTRAIEYFQGTGEFENRDHYPMPAFVIMDLGLPDHSGLEVLHWLKQHPERQVVPVIVFSASEREEDIRRSYELGANTYFVKQPDTSLWEPTFRTMIAYWNQSIKPASPTF